MTNKGIGFRRLRTLLLDLGFSESTGDGQRLRFEYEASGTVLLFRAHDMKDQVNERELVVVRRQLVDNGLIEAPISIAFCNEPRQDKALTFPPSRPSRE